jgi:hydroxymethylpyrimidine pyrophosphatase-like HAD family hydrolase
MNGRQSRPDLNLTYKQLMQSYIFLDLDDTLFQTIRKCSTTIDEQKLLPLAYLADGTPNSYATCKQQWLWQWLQQGFRIIPVTARNFNAFERVKLPFQEEIVLNHGAIILNQNRKIDNTWYEKLKDALPEYQQKLQILWSGIIDYCQHDSNFKCRLIQDFDISLYGVIKCVDQDELPLEQLLEIVIKQHEFITDGSLYWHFNGNNLAVIPKIINKASAVSYLLDKFRQQHPDLLSFGAGDSKTDAEFMALCDYALIPKNSQLFQSLTVFQ